MPDPISRDTAAATLLRLGCRILDEEGGLVLFGRTDLRSYLFVTDFSRGAIPWDDFREQLE